MRTHLSAIVLLALNFLVFLVLNHLWIHIQICWTIGCGLVLSASTWAPSDGGFPDTLYHQHRWTPRDFMEIGAQLVNLAIIYLIFRLALSIFHTRAALFTLFVLSSMPYFTLGTVFLHHPALCFLLGARTHAARPLSPWTSSQVADFHRSRQGLEPYPSSSCFFI